MSNRQTKDKFWGAARVLLGRRLYEYARAYYNLGYLPNFYNPNSFSEKIIHRKFFDTVQDAHVYADKYAVRAHVARKIGEEFLTKLYFAGNDPQEIPFKDLPEKFAVKANHGCGGNLFIRDKAKVNSAYIVEWCRKAMADDFGYLTNEQFYRRIEKKILIEELLEDGENDNPPDFKFFCFQGEPRYIQVDLDRFTEHTRTYYDADWEKQDFTLKYPLGKNMEKPQNFEEMKDVARKLSSGFDFVRIDLYSVRGRTIFGEITLTPESGWGKLNPPQADFTMGALWR